MSFGEKVVMNGLMSFITHTETQVTFGLLSAAGIMIVKLACAPFAKVDSGRLAKLLMVATYLLLLVGAQAVLMEAQEWTPMARAVQNCIVWGAGLCAVVGLSLIFKDIGLRLLLLRREYLDKWLRQKNLPRAVHTDFSLSALVVRCKKCTQRNQHVQPVSPTAEADTMSPTAAIEEAAKPRTRDQFARTLRWGMIQFLQAEAELDTTRPGHMRILVASYMRILHRKFQAEIQETGINVAALMQTTQVRLRVRSADTQAEAPPMPLATTRLASVLAAVQEEKAALAALSYQDVHLPDLLGRLVVPGVKRLSVMVRSLQGTGACTGWGGSSHVLVTSQVGTPPQRLFLDLLRDGRLQTPANETYASPAALYIDPQALAGQRMAVVQGSLLRSMWCVLVSGLGHCWNSTVVSVPRAVFHLWQVPPKCRKECKRTDIGRGAGS